MLGCLGHQSLCRTDGAVVLGFAASVLSEPAFGVFFDDFKTAFGGLSVTVFIA